jgi:hypothetical protein
MSLGHGGRRNAAEDSFYAVNLDSKILPWQAPPRMGASRRRVLAMT